MGDASPPVRTGGVDTRHLKAVVAVARLGSFTGAALGLFMAQSTVSRQVAAVERQLGADLFVRGLRTVELTAVGEAFLPEAERVLEAVARAEEVVRERRARRVRGGQAHPAVPGPPTGGA
jgi:DNA-binding transcriptional LysR family regulator